MSSKTNRKKASTKAQPISVQPEVEGPMLLSLHLPMWSPEHGAVVGEGSKEQQEKREAAAGSCVLVLDLD